MKLLKFKLLFVFFLMFCVINLNAQVTIGVDEEPDTFALLQLKDKQIVAGDAPDAKNALTGGLLLPRVELVKKHELLPFVSEGVMNDPAEYQRLKLSHTGLIVFNLIDNGTELCRGLNQWDGEKWNCFQEKIGNAVATIDCDNISFSGQYLNNVSLDGSNTMRLNLHVTKRGAYTITVMATQSDTSGANTGTDNGYFFTVTGMFLVEGDFVLTLPGAGKPIAYTDPDDGSNLGDYLSIKFNDEELCVARLFIENSAAKPNYTMNCNTVKVYGTYIVNQELNPNDDVLTHYITMNLSADPDAVGASYSIKTNTVDGIYFEGKGKLVAGSQTITLVGKGTPTTTDTKYFTITSNSTKSAATCNATVVVMILKKRILGIGTNEGTYGWSPTIAGTGSNKMTTSPNNFGPYEYSTVRVESLELTHLPYGTDLTGYMSTIRGYLEGTNGNPPVDICIIAQDVYLSASTAEYFANYVDKGGVLLVFNEGNGYYDAGINYPRGTITNLMKAIWGSPANTTITDFGYSRRVNHASDSYMGSPGAVYPLTNVNDDILNGPFGDIRAKQWGEDASWARGVKNIPLDDIYIYSYATNLMVTNQDPEASGLITAFRHKYKNFVFVGDGGFLSSTVNATGTPTSNSNSICPFWWQAGTFTPAPKQNYGLSREVTTTRPPTRSVYNSTMYCNILAWALIQAEMNGINTNP